MSTSTLKKISVIGVVILMLASMPAAADTYARNRLVSAADAIGVEVKHLALINRLESPQRSVFRITLRVTNDDQLPVEYTAGGITAALGPNTIAISGTEQGSLAPGESVDLTRDFVLAEATLAGLRGQGQVTITGSLELGLRVSWLRWEVERDVLGRFEHSVLFD